MPLNVDNPSIKLILSRRYVRIRHCYVYYSCYRPTVEDDDDDDEFSVGDLKSLST